MLTAWFGGRQKRRLGSDCDDGWVRIPLRCLCKRATSARTPKKQCSLFVVAASNERTSANSSRLKVNTNPNKSTTTRTYTHTHTHTHTHYHITHEGKHKHAHLHINTNALTQLVRLRLVPSMPCMIERRPEERQRM